MKTPLLAIALLTAAVGIAHATEGPLLAAGVRDQIANGVVSAAAPTGNIERAPVQFSWAIDPYQPLAASAPHVSQSREYWQTVDAATLQRGVAVRTSAPGALIRVSPSRNARAIDVTQVRVLSAGREAAIERRTSSAQLQAANMPVPDGTAAVQLTSTQRAGTYQVQVADARGDYVVHVYEPQSSVRLSLAMGRDRAFAGGRGNVAVGLHDGAMRMPGLRASGLLVSPTGESWPLKLAPSSAGMLEGDVPVPADAQSAPGLWEVQVFASDSSGLQRDGRTAFAVSRPTARLAGDFAFDTRRLRFDLPVQAGASGRYEARGTLYATAADGVLRPVSVAHSAAWFAPGMRSLALAFDRAHVPAGFGAPFELRELELNDQSRNAPLERRARAVAGLR